MPKHSPAPWDRGTISEALTIWAGEKPIVFVYKAIVDKEEAEANARLIEAAPDLLVALKKVMEFHYHPLGPDFPEAWAAIKKAEGRE
jgi:hypothetical protein